MVESISIFNSSRFYHPCGLAEHHGMVDCTPPNSELVRMGFNSTLISEPLNVHSGHTVVIGPVAAVQALVFVQPFVPVRLAYHAAFRTGLTRVMRVNRNGGMPGFQSLVFNHLAKLVEGPADLRIPVLSANFFRGVANAFEVFQPEERRL